LEHPGVNVTILKIFSPKNGRKIVVFACSYGHTNSSILCFVKKALGLFAKNGQNRQKCIHNDNNIDLVLCSNPLQCRVAMPNDAQVC
jgi:hypothetical protein